MFEYYGYPVTELIEKEAWYTDFGLGDFEHCGMGGIFWAKRLGKPVLLTRHLFVAVSDDSRTLACKNQVPC